MTTQLTSADLGTFTEVGIIGGFSGNNSSLDEIRIGNSFADVAPVQAVLSATQDTYLFKDQPSDNFGSSSTLVLDKGGGDIGESLPVVQFDVSSIPVGATISSATLQLEALSGPGSSIDVGIYELLQSWTEGDGTAGPANWTQSSSGVDWVGSSGDPHESYNATAIATLDTAATGQHSWDVTALVEAWIDGSKTNNGFILGSVDGGSDTFTYSSREGVTPPTLVINYATTVVPPTADAGGPYTINEGDSVNLDGSGSSDSDGTIVSYRWDLDNDGVYEEAGEPTSDTATVSWATLAGFGINNEGTYNIRLQVTDNDGETDETSVAITVNNVAPSISSSLTPSIAENTTAVQTVTTTEPTDPVTFTITGGADQGLFTINGSGALSFFAAPDFESPSDSDWDNVYEVEITTDDGTDSDVRTLSVTVTNTNDVSVVGVGDTYQVNEDTSLDSSSTWFDGDWGFRRTISFDNTGQSETITNMPVLVELDSSVIDYSKVQDAGEDLRFTDSSGNLLAHDIELWNESGTSYAWVLVPSITQSSAANSVFMYYGNGAVAMDRTSPEFGQISMLFITCTMMLPTAQSTTTMGPTQAQRMR